MKRFAATLYVIKRFEASGKVSISFSDLPALVPTELRSIFKEKDHEPYNEFIRTTVAINPELAANEVEFSIALSCGDIDIGYGEFNEIYGSFSEKFPISGQTEAEAEKAFLSAWDDCVKQFASKHGTVERHAPEKKAGEEKAGVAEGSTPNSWTTGKILTTAAGGAILLGLFAYRVLSKNPAKSFSHIPRLG